MPVGNKVTAMDVVGMKGRQKVTMITAYDYPSALLVDKAGIDVILVGDSGGMVVLGYETTIPVTMDEMVLMCKAVTRGAKRPLIVADMPFMSFNAGIEEAVRNAGRLVKEGGVDAVKPEGGEEFAGVVRAITRAGIPVMGHIGLTPQTATIWSGYKVQGRTAESAKKIISSAKALEEAGAFSIVLESITAEVAERVTESVKVPTIGIGSGPSCDGQVLVLHDVLGLYDRLTPKFVKRYADLSTTILEALKAYRDDVLSGAFPSEGHTFRMKEEEYAKLGAGGEQQA